MHLQLKGARCHAANRGAGAVQKGTSKDEEVLEVLLLETCLMSPKK